MAKREVVWTEVSEIQLKEILDFLRKEIKADNIQDNFTISLKQN